MTHNFIVKNVTNQPISIQGISTYGITVNPNKTLDLLQLATISQITACKNLSLAISAGKLVVIIDGKAASKTDATTYAVTGIPPQYLTPKKPNLNEILDISTSNIEDESWVAYSRTAKKWIAYSTKPGYITRDNGQILSIVFTGGKTWTFQRDVNGSISSVTNGAKTLNFYRNSDGNIQSWNISGG